MIRIITGIEKDTSGVLKIKLDDGSYLGGLVSLDGDAFTLEAKGNVNTATLLIPQDAVYTDGDTP